MFSKQQYIAIFSTMVELIGYGGSDSMNVICHFIEEVKPTFTSHVEAYMLSKQMRQPERARLLCVNDLNAKQIEKIKSWWGDCLRPYTRYFDTSWGYQKFMEKMDEVTFISMENGIPVGDIDMYI